MTDANYKRSRDVEDRAGWWQKLQWRLETFAWDWIYWAPFKAMGIDRASDFGAWLFRTIGPKVSQHQTMLRNLRLAFPDWPEAEIEATARRTWDGFGRTAGELPHLPQIDPYEPGGRVEVVNPEGIDAVRESGRGAVLISGHFANWEVMASVICRRPLDCYVTYRALNNPHIDRRLNAVRRAYGINTLTPKGLGTREIMNALKADKAVALLNDQKFNSGLALPFFGYDAMTAPGPTRLAMKYGVPIVPFSTVRTGKGRFRVTVHDPIEIADTGHPEADIVETVSRINAFIEARVREHPDQWFWMHRRWPKEAWKTAGALEPNS